MSELDFDLALSFALKTARKGAGLAVEYHSKIDPAKAGASLDIENKSPRDYVTKADFDVQNLIIDEIKKELESSKKIFRKKNILSIESLLRKKELTI